MFHCLPLLTALFMTMASALECPASIPADTNCPGGCYHASGIFHDDGSRPCEAVGVGHYSPTNDNRRLPCELGTASNIETAESCASCPAGSHSSSAGLSECDACPMGTYSGLPRSLFCSPCDPTYYSGVGANSVQVWNGQVYCMLASLQQPASLDSNAPSAAPSVSSDFKTVAPTPLDFVDTNGTSLDDDALESSIDALNCSSTEYVWHDQCRQCPATIQAYLHPVWLLLVVSVLVSVLFYLPRCCSALVWMGVEYLQFAYFLALVPIPSHKLLQYPHYILSILALDLDVGFSLQCILDVDPYMDQIVVLGTPVAVAVFLWIISNAVEAIRLHYARWLAIGLSLGQFKLVLTSLEALHCTGNSWFCKDPMIAFAAGIAGLAIYGILFPMALLWKRLDSTPAAAADSIKTRWLSDFPYSESWWWTGFLMLRKSALAALFIVYIQQPTMVLCGLLVSLMAMEMIQRCVSPLPEDCPGRSRWLRNLTVDTILQASLIGLTGLGFLALAIPSGKSIANGFVVAIAYFAVSIPTLIFWLVAILHCHWVCSCNANDNKGGEQEARSTTSTSSNSRRAESPPTTLVASNSPDREATSAPVVTLGAKATANNDEVTIPHSFSLIPHPGSGDDLEMATVIDESALQGWQETQDYEEWIGTGNCAIGNALGRSPVTTPTASYDEEDPPAGGTMKQNYLRSNAQIQPTFSNEVSTLTKSKKAGKTLSFDDAEPTEHNPVFNPHSIEQSQSYDYSTMTESSASKKPQKARMARFRSNERDAPAMAEATNDSDPRQLYEYPNKAEPIGANTKHANPEPRSRVQPFIYPPTVPSTNDQEVASTLEEVVLGAQNPEEASVFDDEMEEETILDDMTEVWVDEVTGLPVDKRSGEWTDANTGLRVDTAEDMELGSCHRVEPASWVQRQESYFRPEV